jgi:hypothetical protein
MAGFKYRKSQAGGGTTGNVSTFGVAAAHITLLAPGDAVQITGDGDAATGISLVDTGNAATLNTGVIESVDIQLAGESLTETGLPALTGGTVKVRVDQYALYEIDADATYNAASVGMNTAINITTATKSGGLTVSNMTADFATVAVTAALPYRVVALLEDADGVLGNRVLLRPNATTATAGAVGIA